MTRSRHRTRRRLVLLLAGTPSLAGCFAMSSYQSARITDEGPSHTTFAVSRLSTTEADDAGGLAVVDLRVRKAMSPRRTDIGLVASVFLLEEGGTALVGVEPRVAMVRDHLALGVPLAWYVGVPVLQLSPGLIATAPVSSQLGVNASARVWIMAGPGGAIARPVYGIGLELGGASRRWTVRPEVAACPLGDEGSDWLIQVGVGFEQTGSGQ